MLKLTSKVASSITSVGNKDPKLLQDLLAIQKVVAIWYVNVVWLNCSQLTFRLGSLQKLAVTLTRASEALKIWGLAEGEDLGVCLFSMTLL